MTGNLGPFQQWLRDVVWTLHGARRPNPPWPTRVNSLLFVCHANVCRSPFAAHLAAHRLRRLGFTHVRCASTGFRITPLMAPPPDALLVAARYGVDLTSHRPELITEDLVRQHDAVLVMEPGQLALLQRRWPDQRQRCFLLSRFAVPDKGTGAFARLHIEDPYGRGEAAFAASYARIARAVDGVVARIATAGPCQNQPQ